MSEKTIESMVKEKQQEMASKNMPQNEKTVVGDEPSAGKGGGALKNAEGDLKRIETDLKISPSAEIELGMIGQLRGIIEKLKSGQMDLATAQNLLRNVNSLKGKVMTELRSTNSMMKSAKEMDANIDKLSKLINEKYEKELSDAKQSEGIEEIQKLLKNLEDKKKKLGELMGYLMAEQKAFKGLEKGLKGIEFALKKQIQEPSKSVTAPVGIGKFITAITNGIASLMSRTGSVNLPKDIDKRVPLARKNKDGVKDIENSNEGILKILADYGDIDKVKRILGADKLKQDLTKPINIQKEESRNSIERTTNKVQQLEIAEKHGTIKIAPIVKHGKNKLYDPKEMSTKTKGKTKTKEASEVREMK